METISPPPIIIEHQKRGICFHVDKPCFTIETPKNKPHEKIRLNYYKNRMISIAKSSQSPDLNMSLNEIRTGIKKSEQVKATLFVYIVGVLILFTFINS